MIQTKLTHAFTKEIPTRTPATAEIESDSGSGTDFLQICDSVSE